MKGKLTYESLRLDLDAEAKAIEGWLREEIFVSMRKKGAVLGISGGIDSSVCAAICVKSLGRERVLGLFMPEMESEKETNRFGEMIADFLGIETLDEDITPILKAAGCYKRRDDGIRISVPEFDEGWKSKVVLPSILGSDRLNISQIVTRSPEGIEVTKRMNSISYHQVVAASNFKQRSRKMIEYYHGDRLNYAVVGTPNKLEYDLGFFVKNGDGAADIKPIAHLYKSQVYQLAEHYNIPKEIRERPPTTDTYSLPQTQEEFYFSLPYDKMDLALYAYENDHSPEDLAEALGTTAEQAERIFKDIRNKVRGAEFLHRPPVIYH